VNGNEVLHCSSAKQDFCNPGLAGLLWGLEGCGGRRGGHPSLLCPLLALAHGSGSEE